MFNQPFSSNGRIRRSEFGLSCIISGVINIITEILAASGDVAVIVAFVIYIPNLWFMLAQGAKRCHDLGHSGWWQIIPFYSLWMLFQDGERCTNEYGPSPKYASNQQQSYSTDCYVKEDCPREKSGRETLHIDAKTVLLPSNGNPMPGLLKDQLGRRYYLQSGTNTIGRADSDSSASIQIDTEDRYMSRNHAAIDVEQSSRGLRHLLRYGYNTQISIMVNGRRLGNDTHVELHNGDTITMGHTPLTFVIEN